MTGDNLTWMEYMRQLIGEYHLNHTFWCFNANSGDTGGLVLDDFTTWDEDKYEFVKEVLWQDADGRFIGLDHEIPLGVNGIALKDYDGVMIDLTITPSPTSSSEETDPTYSTCDGTEAVPAQEEKGSGAVIEVTKGGKIAFAVAGVAILGVIGLFVSIAIKNRRNSQ